MIAETGEYILFRIGTIDSGEIVLVHKYKYEKSSYEIVGNTVTQIALWRSPDAQYFKDVTSFVFFKYFIPKYGAIMSDELQTYDGARFWRNQIAVAARRGMKVGLVDFNNDLSSWLSSLDVWGFADRHEKLRLVILDYDD